MVDVGFWGVARRAHPSGVPTFHCWLRERGTRQLERASLWLAPLQKIYSPEKKHVYCTSYMCKSKLNSQELILPNSINKNFKKIKTHLKLKTLSGLLCLGQTLQNFYLVVVLRLLLNCYLCLRFGQWPLILQKWITHWGRKRSFCPHCILKEQLMLISSVTWLWLLSSSSWAEVYIVGESSSTSLANCGSTHLLETHLSKHSTFLDEIGEWR